MSDGASPAFRRVGVVLALLSAVGFSFKAVLVKLAYPYGVDAVTLLTLRMGLSLPFFLALGLADARRRAVPVDRRDRVRLVALGFFGYYLASLLDFLGLQHVSASLERIVLFSYPTLVVVLSALLLGTPISRRAAAALALCSSGVVLAFAHDVRSLGPTPELLLGVGLVLGSSLSYALYLVAHGEIVRRVGAACVSSSATSVAAGCVIAQFALTRPWSALDLPAPVWGLAGAMALFSTVLPVWGTSEAIRRVGAGPVALVGTIGPVITIALGALVLGDRIGAEQVVGAALVVAGVVLVATRPG